MFSLVLLLFGLSVSGWALAQVSSGGQPSTESGNNEQLGENQTVTDKKSYPFLVPGRNRQETSETSADALTVSLGLIFILVLIFSLAWFMRKMGYSNISGHGQLKLLATMNLGQKEKIVLIQVGKQQLLVGITANQINTLHVLDEPLETFESETSQPGDNRFAKKLSDTLAGMKVKN